GYNLSTLVAGLGVGGVAIAFALQNILGDFFAAFSIYFDKPCETGDYMTVGDEGGTVEKIGIKSTRIKTLRGEELVVSNKNLTDMKIHNFKKMKTRRITFSIGVTYDTSTEKLRKAKEIIKDVLVKVKKIELDQVNFVNFGDFSLDFEIAYYVQSKEFTFYKKKQEEINLKIKEEFEKKGIEMAYPTQTILINKKS
ncbi:MAG: mechanosensitive ion channel family protein, partial [Minisyncoccales bacterium]